MVFLVFLPLGPDCISLIHSDFPRSQRGRSSASQVEGLARSAALNLIVSDSSCDPRAYARSKALLMSGRAIDSAPSFSIAP